MWFFPPCDFQVRPLAWDVAIATALIAAILDIKSRRVPNWLSGPVLLSGLIWAAYSGGASAAADSLAGCFILALPYVLLFVFAGGGAGDAKLMGALGAWLGVVNGALVLFAVAISGVLLGIGMAVAKKQTSTVLGNVRNIVGTISILRHRHGGLSDAQDLLPKPKEMLTMPYAVAIFSGVCMAAGGVFIWHS